MENIIRTHVHRVALGLLLTCLAMSFAKAQGTFDLAMVEPNTIPPGGSLEWHTAIPVSAGNLVANKNAVPAGLYYAVYNYGSDCYSKPSPYKIIQASCSGTADITASVETTDVPAGSEVTYHTSSPATNNNKLTTANMSTAAVGSYYVAYYSTTGMCYSQASPVRVIAAMCNSVTIAKNDINQTPANTPAHGNVLTNDSDPDGNVQIVNTVNNSAGAPLIVDGTTENILPSGGKLVISNLGIYTYTPADDYLGTDSFTYQVCDNGAPQACATATVTIQVVPKAGTGNTAPIANDDTGKTPSDVSLTGKLTNNDSDPDGDLLTVKVVPITGPSHGTATLNPNGIFVYTADPGFEGVDEIVYEVCDNGNPALCDQAKLVITVTAPNPANETYANDDANTGRKKAILTGNVSANDSDPEGNSQLLSDVKNSAGASLIVDGTTENTLPGGGKLIISNTGIYTYTPDPGFVGTKVLTYTTCDVVSPAACATAIIYLTSLETNSVNAVNDINETPAGVPAHGNVLTNDNDPDGNSLTVNTAPVSGPAHGSLTLNSNGTYIYTPEDDYTGTDSFTYQVCDSGTPQECGTATATIQVIPVVDVGNNPPIANDDTGTTPNTVPLTGKVTNNDSDPDGNPLTVSTISGPVHGSIVINSTTGTFTYTPTTGYEGQDVIEYQVCDNGSPALCDPARLVITVTGPNSTNVTYANDDARIARKGVTMTGNVADNDSDPEDNEREVGPFSTSTGTSLEANGTEYTLPSGGKLTIAGDGAYTYKPNPDFVGTEVLTYFSCDSGAPTACAPATLYLTTLDLDSELPVTLIDFKARRTSEGAVLEWHTAAEKDFDRFELETSSDAARGFHMLNTMKGGKNNYVYTDRILTPDARYYRLKMIDTDGTFAYSRIVGVSGEGGSITSNLYPNPVSGYRLYLKTTQPIDGYQVYDAAGKPVTVRISRSSDRYEITLDNDAHPGMYILTYKVHGQTTTHKFVVSN